MAKGWTPPKGISVIYKGKGFRKRASADEERDDDEKKRDEEEKDED